MIETQTFITYFILCASITAVVALMQIKGILEDILEELKDDDE